MPDRPCDNLVGQTSQTLEQAQLSAIRGAEPLVTAGNR